MKNTSGILTRIVDSFKDARDEAAKLSKILDKRASKMNLVTDQVDVWYRGQAKRSYKLIPSLLRFSDGPKVERELLQEYKLNFPRSDDWFTLFEMQHYFVPTRLLDWTTIIDVALYFAANADETDSPCIFLLHPSILNSHARKAINSPKIKIDSKPLNFEYRNAPFKYREDWLIECEKGCARPVSIRPPSGFEPEFLRFRNQASCFTLHGNDPLPLEEQCPEAIAKIELHNFDPKQTANYFREIGLKHNYIFPDRTGTAMYLRDRFNLKPDPEKRIVSTLKNIWIHDHAHLREKDQTALHIPGISSCSVDDMYIDRKEANKIRTWLTNDSKPLAVVTGPAACGKTNFLVNTILTKNFYKKHPVLFYSLGNYNPRRQKLMSCVSEFLSNIPSRDYEQINPNVLSGMITDGSILIILDGLDELARNHGEESVQHLDTELHRLIGIGKPKIIIACRHHIYEKLKRLDKTAMNSSHCQTIPLKPLVRKEVYQKLQDQLRKIKRTDIKLKKRSIAFEIMANIPLFYGVLSHHLNSIGTKLSKISSKAQFWEMWLCLSTQHNFGSERNGDIVKILQRFGSVAVEMLAQRSDYLENKELTQQTSIVEQYAGTDCPVFVKEENDKWRFIHQAIREYALAFCMKIGLENHLEDSVITHTPSFDYESVETYLYLKELLPGNSLDPIIKSLGDELIAIDDKKKWNNFTRNYFEAVGMIGTSDKNMLNMAISQALKVLSDPLTVHGHRANFLTKFNAARCICRLHSTSPSSYCEHVSEYIWQKNPQRYKLVFGYAVRGFQKSHHQPGKYPPEVFISNPGVDDHQEEVTKQLLAVINELIKYEELPPNGEFLKLNVSHALIRWFYPNKQNVERVKEFLLLSELNWEIKANLVLGLHVNCGITNKMEEVLEVTKKYPNGVQVNKEKLAMFCKEK